MALDVIDHALLGMAQRQHEQFLAQLHHGELRELRERLAEAALLCIEQLNPPEKS